MRVLQHLFDNNKAWSERVRRDDPQFFERLSQQQSPRYLWIGCSDSRVPANEIIGLPPGEVFVHRNVANVVVHTDLNCLSVMQFAVDLLKVEHVMVVGHYGCGGVRVALRGERVGLADHWIGHVKDVAERHEARIRPLYHESHQVDRLCELNVIEQVHNVCQSTIVRDAWERGQPLSVHGWIYGLSNGLLRDLGVTAQNRKEAAERHEAALAALS
jgi:carbonic anhydrase